MKKVAIVGIGNVGIAYLNALISEKNLVNDIVLIDVNKDKLNGEYLDVIDSLSVIDSSINITIGNYSDVKDADILVICAGKNQDKGETRLDLLNINAKIVKGITENAIINGFNGIFIVATNPVDIMSYLVYKTSKMSPNNIIGSGTVLDTARLKNIIKEKVNVNTSDISINVVGEHGDNLVILWSKGYINMIPINDIISSKDKGIMDEKLRNRAYDIINKKGYTSEGISLSLLEITKAILNNSYKVLNVSTYYNGIYIGMPSLVYMNGIKGVVNIDFTDEELKELERSISVITDTIEKMEV